MKTSTKAMLVVTGALVAAAAITAAVTISQNNQAIPEAPINPANNLAAASAPDSHLLTSPESSTVTFVEFLDFECESCGAVYPYIEDLRAEFGDRVTFVMRYFPLPGHVNSTNAAVAVEAASRQGMLIPMYQRLFEKQAEWGEQQVSRADTFREYAGQLGLDLAQYDADVADPSTLERVEADFAAGLALGVQSTPTMFVNDVPLELRSIDDIRSAIVAALDAD